MLLVKVLMSPRITWMQVFEDFKEILRDALFQVIGDFIPRENIYFESEYGENFFSKVIVRMHWKQPWTPSPILRKTIADHTLDQVAEFIRVNMTSAVTDVEIYANCKE